jgi:L-lactate utilization protein LutC
MDFNQLATKETVEQVIENLKNRGITAILVETKEQALEKIKELIPEGVSIMTGSSTTLDQIGFTDLLISKNHPWKNLKDEILNESDTQKRNELRKNSVLADYFLGSVHAVTKDGGILVASASGSQIPSYAFSSNNVIWVVSTKKIVNNLDKAFQRVKEHIYPLENQRMKNAGHEGSIIGKWFILEREILPNRKITLIFVNKDLGF